MKRLILAVAMLLVAGAAPASSDSGVAAALTAVVDKAVAADQFSGVVLLAKGGKPVMAKAWGFADPAHNVPNRTDTKFNLGSINKIFTRVAIGQLAAAGKLSLDDTIRKHLPDYPSPVAGKITIDQLVEHKSGLGDFFGPEFMAAPNSIRTLSDYLPLFVKKPLQFDPGTDQRYSNAGYLVLGLIIERVSGQSYYDYVRDHIFKPAGMKDTASYEIDAKVLNRAIGLTKRGPEGPLARRESNAPLQPGRGSSAGGGYSTAGDLLRFSEALRSDTLLPKKWTDWVFHDGPRNLGIAGGSPGVNAVLLMGTRYTLVVLSNFDPPSAEEITRVARPLMGMPEPQRLVTRQEEPDEVLIRGPVDLPLNVTDHLPVIEAKINGKGPYRFAVDTGFGGIVEVNGALAEQLALPVIGQAMSGDPSGRNPEKIRVFRAESVDVGSAHFGGVSVGESARQQPGDVDGVIGLRLFHGLLVKFDYVNGRFALHGGSLPANGTLAYGTEHGVPTIEIEVNGVKAKVDIDSGSPAEVSLPLSMAKSLSLASEPAKVGHGRTADGEFDVYAAPLNGEVHVGTLVLTNPRLDFVSVFPNGNLGYRFLKALIITFDPANRRVKFEVGGRAFPSY